jgi:acetyltransferase-like isoleucine patch superfamily enzyme
MLKNMFTKIFFRINNLYRKLKLRKTNVVLLSGVLFNNKTKFGRNIKIYKNTSILDSEIGNGTYVGWNAVYNNCRIGKFCSIAPFSKIIYGKHPSSTFISTHPAFFSINKQAGFTFTNSNVFEENSYVLKDEKISVTIGNDVWIGHGVSIMEGLEIGDGAIIATGAVVTKNVPAYAVVAGVPSRIIKYRFTECEIEKLKELRWWDKDISWIQNNFHLFKNISNINLLED